jgi:hypothetical protein
LHRSLHRCRNDTTHTTTTPPPPIITSTPTSVPYVHWFRVCCLLGHWPRSHRKPDPSQRPSPPPPGPIRIPPTSLTLIPTATHISYPRAATRVTKAEPSRRQTANRGCAERYTAQPMTCITYSVTVTLTLPCLLAPATGNNTSTLHTSKNAPQVEPCAPSKPSARDC